MRKTIITFCILLLAGPACAAVKVVATLPWIGSLAKEIGKDNVTVTTLVKVSQDPHSIEAKPSMIAAARRADIFMYNGLDLEIGYLPILMEASKNPKIHPGNVGNLNCSVFATPLEIPTSAGRENGDVHPLGNPHYHLSPANMKKVASGMGERLAKIDPANADFYRSNATRFAAQVDRKSKEWQGRPLHGKQFVAQHKFFEYLAAEFGFRIVGYLEDKPGIPPSSAHLQALIADIARQKPSAILSTSYHDQKSPQFVSSKTGVPTKVVPHDVGAAGSTDWFTLMDAVFKTLE
ncbi:MAG: metal ABC transporter substrate-binding protein [Desulfuromonadaceae bacterium]